MKTIRTLLAAALCVALSSCQGPFGLSIEPVWIGGPPIYGIGGYCRPSYRPAPYCPTRFSQDCGPRYRRPPCPPPYYRPRCY